MKYLVATRADSHIDEITEITHPIIKKFCNIWGADFVVLCGESVCERGERRNHYRIMDLWGLFESYDRILSLDSDIIINRNCPNIFEEVPIDCIGTVFEDRGTRRLARYKRILSIQDKHGDVGWRDGYINTGVFLSSKQHRNIYTSINGDYWLGEGEDDVHIGYKIRKEGYKIKELDYRWNHMTMFSEGWNNYRDRFDSYIIHYAGSGKFDEKDRMSQIMSDATRLDYTKKPYKSTTHFRLI